MDWQGLLIQAVSSAAVSAMVITVIGLVARSLFLQWMARNIERFRAALAMENTRATEQLRASLQLEAQRQHVVFGSLHTRRAEVIAELYGKLDRLHQALQRLVGEKWARGVREEVAAELNLPPKEPLQLRPGYEVLSPSEREAMENMQLIAEDFQQFSGQHRIYFTSTACDLLDRLGGLSAFVASNYRNVTYKDEKGRLYVNDTVRKVWDGAVKIIPELRARLETEFRTILGVTPN